MLVNISGSSIYPPIISSNALCVLPGSILILLSRSKSFYNFRSLIYITVFLTEFDPMSVLLYGRNM